ncbi:thioredoxin-like protein [Naematelia encephala]|uniref:thioredoxin-dependent peroxiredoxin n=1 Tax=Naematelia encephala TaxID=71784 RepID=A0A1Y2B1T8_9TREE|nr:thioredoxin-like protein [Naematelia encephala]
MTHPLIGKPAPQLELPSVPDGGPYKLPIGEKPIALFFFPKAGSKGCTMEACSFRDAQNENVTFKRHPGLTVVGISSDSTEKQQIFADQHSLPYPLISDVDSKAREAYQVDKAFLGLSQGRSTFFIDSKGTIKGVCDKMLDYSAHVKFVEKMLIEIE